jgi:AraC-like DNA-binding protein
MHRLNRRVERRRERVFVKRCHAGVLEVVAPIYWNGAHVGTLFAGLWRPRHSHVEVAQPPVEPERVRRLLRVLPVLADGLAARFWGRRELLTAAASRVAAIEDYIAAHCRSGITLSSMAGHLGVSASRASHLIRELTGQTFSDLVQAKRLELAEFYLVSSDYRMKEVAQLCGFSGQEHFGRIFRRRCGRTPAVFRKQEQQRHF